jgi:hypothetical protein
MSGAAAARAAIRRPPEREVREARLRFARSEASKHLDQIQQLWNPGMKVTLLVRSPDHPDGSRDFMLTDDQIPDVIAALEILKTRPAL